MPRPMSLALALAACAVLAGCGQRSEPSSTPTAGDTPPATSTPAETPPAGAVSKYDDGPRAGAVPADAALARQGAELFRAKGCVACHAWGQQLTGPDLKGVSMRRTQVWLENQILHPEVMLKEDPITIAVAANHKLVMTNQNLTPDQAKAVIEHLKQQDQDAGLKPER